MRLKFPPIPLRLSEVAPNIHWILMSFRNEQSEPKERKRTNTAEAAIKQNSKGTLAAADPASPWV